MRGNGGQKAGLGISELSSAYCISLPVQVYVCTIPTAYKLCIANGKVLAIS